MKKPGFFDQYTRIDELLEQNTVAVNRLADILQLKGDTIKPLFLTYPSSGSALVTISEGTTILNFETGTITDIDGEVTNMKQSLQKRGFEWARSFFIQSDKLVSVQIDDNDPIIASEERDASGINQQFKRIKLVAYENTDVFVIASTSPDALIQLIANAVVISDTKDVYGNRSYIGLGELAARLGSIKTYTKQGEIVFMDDFEDSTLKWNTTSTGSGGSVVKTNEKVHSGNFALKMTTGNAADNYALLYKYFPRPFSNRLGLECSFTIEDDTKWFWINGVFYTGTTRYRTGIRYDYPNRKLLYLNSSNVFADLQTDLDVYPYNQSYHTLKYTVDITTKKYITCFFNHLEIDMSILDIYNTGSIGTPAAEVFIYHSTNVASNKYIYFDNFIYTQNET